MTFIHDGMEFIVRVRESDACVGMYIDQNGNFQEVLRDSIYGRMIIQRIARNRNIAKIVDFPVSDAIVDLLLNLGHTMALAHGGPLLLSNLRTMTALDLLQLIAPNNIRFTWRKP